MASEKKIFISGKYSARNGDIGSLLVSVEKRPREPTAIEILIIRTGDNDSNDIEIVHRCVVDIRLKSSKVYQGQVVQIHGESGFQTKCIKEMTVEEMNKDEENNRLVLKIRVKEFW